MSYKYSYLHRLVRCLAAPVVFLIDEWGISFLHASIKDPSAEGFLIGCWANIIGTLLEMCKETTKHWSVFEWMITILVTSGLLGGVFWLGTISANLSTQTTEVKKLSEKIDPLQSNLDNKITAVRDIIASQGERIATLEGKLDQRTALIHREMQIALAAVTPGGIETLVGIVVNVNAARRKIIVTDAGGNNIEFTIPKEQQFAFSENDIGKVYYIGSTRDTAGNRILLSASTSAQEFASELRRELRFRYTGEGPTVDLKKLEATATNEMEKRPEDTPPSDESTNEP